MRVKGRCAGAAIAVMLTSGCTGEAEHRLRATLTASSNEAFASETVALTLTVDTPPADNLPVWIGSSNPLIVSAPTFVEIRHDESEVTFDVVALQEGGPVTLVASIARDPSVTLVVLPDPAIDLVATTTSADQLSEGTLVITGTASHPRALDPAAATVSAPAGSGVTLGTPVLTGDASGFTLSVPYTIAVNAEPGEVFLDVDTNGDDLGAFSQASLSVVRIPRLAGFEPASAALDTTELRAVLITLDQPARTGGETVTLACSQPTKVDPGEQVLVDEGLDSAVVMIEGLAVTASAASVAAGLADSVANASFTVADATITVPVVTGGGSAFQGDSLTLTATGTGSSYVAVSGTAATLTAPGGSGITVNSVTVTGDHTGWTLSADLSVSGSATVTTQNLSFDANGAVPGSARTIPFQVKALPRVQSLGPDGTAIPTGESRTFTVTLDVAPSTNTAVALSSTSTAISFPSSVTVLASQTTALFDVDGITEGTSLLTASLNGSSDSTSITTTLAQSGQVVISEFTTLTANTANNIGERIELANISGGTVSMNAWTLETLTSGPLSIRAATSPTNDTIAFTVTSGRIVFGVPNPADPAQIPAGAAFVYGDPGVAAQIANSGDRLRLFATPSQMVDEVDFRAFVKAGTTALGAADFPGTAGHSTQVDPAGLDAYLNDDGGVWCTTFRSADTLGGAGTNQTCGAEVVINEELYDATGTDGGNLFVELAGNGGAFIGGITLRQFKIDGTLVNSTTMKPFTFATGTRIPCDGLVVVADGISGVTTIPNADFISDTFDPQNGAGESLQLLKADGVSVYDVVQHGAGGPATAFDGTAAREGTTAPNATAPNSLRRSTTSADSNNNVADFTTDSTPTPGTPNS